MKTKDLIEALKQADPSGDLHVCVNNNDIYSVTTLPASYDGCQKIYQHDIKNKGICFSINGVLISGEGRKVQISSYSLEDLLFDDPELPVTYSSCLIEDLYKNIVEQLRDAGRI